MKLLDELEKNITLESSTKQYNLERDTFRIIVGTLGALLPFLLLLFLAIDKGTFEPLDSISHYYYTRVSGVFVLIVGLLAFFLIIYKDKEPIDFVISFFAGFFALIVLMFPTSNISCNANFACNDCAVTILKDIQWRIWLHYISAGLFLGLLAFMSLFLFTKSNRRTAAEMGVQKRRRNRVYKACGIIIILSITVLGVNAFASYKGWISDSFADNINLTFWMEVLALEAFALSWFTKAEVILKDK